MTTARYPVRVRSLTLEAEGILAIELAPVPGAELPPFDAGSHVDLHLPQAIRSYSLAGDPTDHSRYLLAVARSDNSRGASAYVHERLRPGDTLFIGPPRNNFPLNETAKNSVLIAGGIGITPLLSMIARLERIGAAWSLHYSCRSRARAAFLDRIAPFSPSVTLSLRDEVPDRLDFARIVADAPVGTHFYACGPNEMLDVFQEATAHLPPEQTHVERFAPAEPKADGGGFVLTLRRSGLQVTVRPGQTVLDAVLEAGVAAPYSCLEGVCGSCEVAVVAGKPDHRDVILSEDERASGKTMMICVSGAQTPTLTIDL
jgi:ferredoxin-NADP reductase